MSDSLEIPWIPLATHNEQWEFLGSSEAYRVAEQLGTIDYLFAIKEKLPEYELVQKIHERIILISLGALFEYGLKKAAQRDVQKGKDASVVLSTLNLEKEERKLDEEGMEATINRLAEAGLLDMEWKEFLHKVRALRGEVHLDRDRDVNIQGWLEEVGVDGIRDRIDGFRKLIKGIVDTDIPQNWEND